MDLEEVALGDGALELGSEELPGVTREYTSFSQILEENEQSRIYLGVHFDFDQALGTAVGAEVADSISRTQLLSVSPVPEPGSLLLLGLASLGAARRRRR